MCSPFRCDDHGCDDESGCVLSHDRVRVHAHDHDHDHDRAHDHVRAHDHEGLCLIRKFIPHVNLLLLSENGYAHGRSKVPGCLLQDLGWTQGSFFQVPLVEGLKVSRRTLR